MSNLREASKAVWASNNSIEHINCGSLQRIADATELMATNYLDLQRDADWYKSIAAKRLQIIGQQERRIAALRGVITKMKGKK